MSDAVDLTPIERALQAWVVAASGLPDGRVIWSGYGLRRPQLPDPPNNQWISLKFSENNNDAWPWVDELANPLTFTAFTLTADATTPPGILTAAAHARLTGDGPVQLTTTGALPSGLALLTDYWLVVLAANTFRLAASFEDAMAVSPIPVAMTSAGTGVHTLAATDDSLRAGEEQVTVVSDYVSGTLSIQCYGGPPTGSRSPVNILRTVVSSAQLPSRKEAFEDAGIYVNASGRINDIGSVLSSSRYEPRAYVDIEVTYVAEVSETSTIITRVEGTITGSDTELALDITADDAV